MSTSEYLRRSILRRRNAGSARVDGVSGASRPDVRSGGATMAGSLGVSSYLSGTSGSSYSYGNTDAMVGLQNQGATCYLNSLIQSLYMTPEFRLAIYSWEYDEEKDGKADECIPLQLQLLFQQLQAKETRATSTKNLTKSFGWTGMDAFTQHDVQELCRVLLDALEHVFKDTLQKDVVNELYQGKMKDYVKCKSCGHESSRVDEFLDVSLEVSDEVESVEDAFAKFILPELLSGDNQYSCSGCDQKVDAYKGLSFLEMPYLLTIQLKRFTYDYASMRRVKLNSFVSFPMFLDLEPYMSGLDESFDTSLVRTFKERPKTAPRRTPTYSLYPGLTLQRRIDLATTSFRNYERLAETHKNSTLGPTYQRLADGKKAELDRLEEEKKAEDEAAAEAEAAAQAQAEAALAAAQAIIDGDGDGDEENADPDAGDGDGGKEEVEEDEEGEEGEGEDGGDGGKKGVEPVVHNVDSHGIYRGPEEREGKPLMYELFAILIHSGGSTGGHYYAYVKSLDAGKWYDFNDSSVSEVMEHEIVSSYGSKNESSYNSMWSSGTNAYMLMYRRVEPGRNAPFIEEVPEHVVKAMEAFKAKQAEEAASSRSSLYSSSTYSRAGYQPIGSDDDDDMTSLYSRKRYALTTKYFENTTELSATVRFTGSENIGDVKVELLGELRKAWMRVVRSRTAQSEAEAEVAAQAEDDDPEAIAEAEVAAEAETEAVAAADPEAADSDPEAEAEAELAAESGISEDKVMAQAAAELPILFDPTIKPEQMRLRSYSKYYGSIDRVFSAYSGSSLSMSGIMSGDVHVALEIAEAVEVPVEVAANPFSHSSLTAGISPITGFPTTSFDALDDIDRVIANIEDDLNPTPSTPPTPTPEENPDPESSLHVDVPGVDQPVKVKPPPIPPKKTKTEFRFRNEKDQLVRLRLYLPDEDDFGPTHYVYINETTGTVGDLKAVVASTLGVSPEHQLLCTNDHYVEEIDHPDSDTLYGIINSILDTYGNHTVYVENVAPPPLSPPPTPVTPNEGGLEAAFPIDTASPESLPDPPASPGAASSSSSDAGNDDPPEVDALEHDPPTPPESPTPQSPGPFAEPPPGSFMFGFEEDDIDSNIILDDPGTDSLISAIPNADPIPYAPLVNLEDPFTDTFPSYSSSLYATQPPPPPGKPPLASRSAMARKLKAMSTASTNASLTSSSYTSSYTSYRTGGTSSLLSSSTWSRRGESALKIRKRE